MVAHVTHLLLVTSWAGGGARNRQAKQMARIMDESWLLSAGDNAVVAFGVAVAVLVAFRWNRAEPESAELAEI